MTERQELDIAFAGRIAAIDKRVKRLETLEFASVAVGGVGGLIEIETQTKSDDIETSFSFIDIPQIYLHLMVIFSVRSASGLAGLQQLICRINNDSGDHYWSIIDQLYITASGGACNRLCPGYIPAKISYWYCFQIPAPGLDDGNDPDCFNTAHMLISDYRNQYKKKTAVWDNYFNKAEAAATVRALWREEGGGTWHDMSPITRIDFRTPGLVAFLRNSKISLYGIDGTFEEFA